MKEMYEYLPEPSSKFADLATVMLRDPANVYVFHSSEATAFPGYMEAMQRQAAKLHKQLVLAQVINERSGVPNTLIYTAQDTPRSFAISPTLATRNAIFSGGLTLLGGNATYDPTRHEVAVQLYWQNTADKQPDDTILMHIVNQSNGEVVLNADQQPLYGVIPLLAMAEGRSSDRSALDQPACRSEAGRLPGTRGRIRYQVGHAPHHRRPFARFRREQFDATLFRDQVNFT